MVANPLRAYFDDDATIDSPADFAARCSRIDKRLVSPNQVGNWTRTRCPRLATRRLIARASRGAVPVDAWPDPTSPRKTNSYRKHGTSGAPKTLHAAPGAARAPRGRP